MRSQASRPQVKGTPGAYLSRVRLQRLIFSYQYGAQLQAQVTSFTTTDQIRTKQMQRVVIALLLPLKMWRVEERNLKESNGDGLKCLANILLGPHYSGL